MAWKIEFSEESKKFLKKIDQQNAKRITNFIKERLSVLEDPRSISKPLKGELHQYWRYRVGDYRIMCTIEDKEITIIVIKIGHRKEVYRPQ